MYTTQITKSQQSATQGRKEPRIYTPVMPTISEKLQKPSLKFATQPQTLQSAPIRLKPPQTQMLSTPLRTSTTTSTNNKSLVVDRYNPLVEDILSGKSLNAVKERLYNDDEPIMEKAKLTSEKLIAKQDPSTMNMDEMFSISLKMRYNTLQLNSASATIEPVLFTINALSKKNDENKVPLDLICVLDTSGSMDGEKIMLLIDTLKYLVDLLDENDRISIVRFSDVGERLTPLIRVSKTNKSRIRRVIDSLIAGGGTDITDGLKHAVRIINERKYRNPVTSVFLLSDGLDEKAVYGVGELLNTQRPKDNFTIHSFGYGSDHDPNLMSAIAKYKDGNFYFIEKLETVDECFVDAIGGLISVVGQDITITIQGVKSDIFPNLEMKKAFGGADLWKTMGDGAYSTRISQLPSGKSKNYVLELVIPKTSKSLTDQQKFVVLAHAVVTGKVPNSSEVWKKKCKLIVNLMNEEESLPPQIADKAVLNNYYRVRSAEIMLKARKFAENASYEEARKILHNFKEELSRLAVKREPMVIGLLEDIEITIQEMQPKIYENSGKHRLTQQVSSHMEERSNPFSKNSASIYSSPLQREMVTMTRSRRSNQH